jgi:hypothetical protein
MLFILCRPACASMTPLTLFATVPLHDGRVTVRHITAFRIAAHPFDFIRDVWIDSRARDQAFLLQPARTKLIVEPYLPPTRIFKPTEHSSLLSVQLRRTHKVGECNSAPNGNGRHSG